MINLFFDRLQRTFREFLADDCPQRSAAVAYYAMTSVFPALLLAITVLSHFVATEQAQRDALRLVGPYLPVPQIQDYFLENLRSTVRLSGPMGALALLVMVWGSKNLFVALDVGLNAAWRMPRRRATLALHASATAVMLLVWILLASQFVVSAAARAVLSFDHVTLFGHTYPLIRFALVSKLIQWLISPLLLFAIFTLLYKWLPTARVPWNGVWPGALFAAVAWRVVQSVFILYTARLAVASALYGAAGVILALMLWFYLSASIFFLGAELIYVLLAERGVLNHKVVLKEV